MKFVKIVVIVILFLLLALWFGVPFYFSGSVAQYSGEIEHEFIKEEIEITFDEKGIPQIWAKNESDLYFALGWMQASERLLQMELVKRVTYGEIAELLGPGAIEHDQKQRLIGFARKARAELSDIDQETAVLIDAYCKGINAWVSSKSVLPFEFSVFGIEPNQWTIENVLAISIYLSWYAHSLMDKDYEYQYLIDKLGSEATDILMSYDGWSPATVSESVAQIKQSLAYPSYNMSLASNSWVVSSEKSSTGHVIHSSDPHLQVNIAPNFWYLAGLHTDDVDFIGVMGPGVPVTAMGHTKDVAFAFTVASVDLVDYYHVPNIIDDKIILFGKEETIETVTEEIHVNGQSDPEIFTYQKTSLGPIIKDKGRRILKWAGYDFNYGELLSRMLSLKRVKNWNEFRNTVTGLGALDVNWTYSDKDGNYGYQLGAPIPIRSYKNTYEMKDPSNIEHQWQGYLPLDSTPHLYNPQKGFVATSNNQIREKDEERIPGFYDNYRIVRLDEKRQSMEKATVDDMYALQMDRFSVKASRWNELLIQVLERMNENELADKFKTWDFIQRQDDVRPTIFSVWWHRLPKFIFDELGENHAYGSHLLERSLLGEFDWYDRIDTEAEESKMDVLVMCMEDVLKTHRNVSYGDFSLLQINHPIGGASELINFWLDLNRGPFPFESDNSTLNANFPTYDEQLGKTFVLAAPSMRYVLDWSDVNNFTIQTNLGQSGNPFSTHYDDFLEDWLKGQRWIVPIDRDIIEKNVQSRLFLKPKDRE